MTLARITQAARYVPRADGCVPSGVVEAIPQVAVVVADEPEGRPDRRDNGRAVGGGYEGRVPLVAVLHGAVTGSRAGG